LASAVPDLTVTVTLFAPSRPTTTASPRLLRLFATLMFSRMNFSRSAGSTIEPSLPALAADTSMP
jgi:hypothetical protein